MKISKTRIRKRIKRKTNPELVETLFLANKNNFMEVAKVLSGPTRRFQKIDLERLEREVKDGEIIFVPGKVLGEGQMKKKLTVAAYKFSDSAKKTISGCGGKTLTLNELVESKTDPKNILLIC